MRVLRGFRGARSFNTQLHDEATLEHHAVAKLPGESCEESIEDEELAPSGEVRAAR
jgi:hypothetical protein